MLKRVTLMCARLGPSGSLLCVQTYHQMGHLNVGPPYITLIGNRSLAVQLNSDDITREKISETIFFLATLIFFCRLFSTDM